jgi:hypothetical protein
MIQVTRRGLIGSIGALFVAPAIVRAESLMKVKPVLTGAPWDDFETTMLRKNITRGLIEGHNWMEIYHARILNTGFKVSQEMLDVRAAS